MRRWTLRGGAILVTVALTGTVFVNDPESDAATVFAYMLWLGGLVLAVALLWELLSWARTRGAAS